MLGRVATGRCGAISDINGPGPGSAGSEHRSPKRGGAGNSSTNRRVAQPGGIWAGPVWTNQIKTDLETGYLLRNNYMI